MRERTISSRQAGPVSQKQIRQREHDIKFSLLLFEPSVSRFRHVLICFYLYRPVYLLIFFGYYLEIFGCERAVITVKVWWHIEVLFGETDRIKAKGGNWDECDTH